MDDTNGTNDYVSGSRPPTAVGIAVISAFLREPIDGASHVGALLAVRNGNLCWGSHRIARYAASGAILASIVTTVPRTSVRYINLLARSLGVAEIREVIAAGYSWAREERALSYGEEFMLAGPLTIQAYRASYTTVAEMIR